MFKPSPVQRNVFLCLGQSTGRPRKGYGWGRGYGKQEVSKTEGQQSVYHEVVENHQRDVFWYENIRLRYCLIGVNEVNLPDGRKTPIGRTLVTNLVILLSCTYLHTWKSSYLNRSVLLLYLCGRNVFHRVSTQIPLWLNIGRNQRLFC